MPARRPRAAGAAGAGGQRRDGEAVCRSAAKLSFMTAASARVGDFDCHVSPLGLHRRGRLRDLGGGRQGDGPRQAAAGAGERAADRPRRARLAAPGGGALPLRPRHRRDDQPRSRPTSPGRSRSGGASRAASRAPSASATSWPPARRASASASSRKAGRRPARAPRSSSPLGERIGVVTSGGFGPSVNGPVAMGYVESDYAGARHVGEPDGARQGAAGAVDRRRCRSFPHRYCRARS